MYTPEDLDNPIAGTALDPKRRMYLLGSMMPSVADVAPPTDSMPPVGGPPMVDAPAYSGPGSMQREFRISDWTDPMSEKTPIGGDSVNMPPLVRSNAAPTPTSTSMPAPPQAPTGSPTAAAVPGAVNPNDPYGDDADWKEMMDAVRHMGMEDTPSQNRITQLQGQLDQMQKPLTLKQKLLRVGMMAAPTALGGIFGGSAGAAGAAQGTDAAEEELHARGMEDEKILRGEIEAERQRQERQYERRMQLPVTIMNARMLRDYRRGMIDARLRHEDTYADMADTRRRSETNRENKTALDYIKAGINPVTHEAIPPEKLPFMQQSAMRLQDAKTGYTDALTDLARAKASKIPYDIMVAQERVRQAGEAHNVAMQVFMRDTYGLDMGGEPIAGSPMDEQGNVLGWKAGQFVKPSGMEQSRGGQGEAIMQVGDTLVQHIAANKDKIGDIGAIINSAFLGTPLADPKSSELASELASYAALQPALHGFRGQDALNEFMRMIGGLPKNPDALIAAINGIRGTAQVVAEKGKLHTYAPGKATNKLQKSNTSAPAPQVEKWGRDANGKLVRQ